MKLWLISQDANNGYDTYDSAVVVAETEEDARVRSPDEYYVWADGAWRFQYADGTRSKERGHDAWTDPENVKVQLLGEAAENWKAGDQVFELIRY